MKCSLLIQQLIYLSYDYFKHTTKHNETRNCFLEDFFCLLFFPFNWNECFLSTHTNPLGFAISLLCFILCFLRNQKKTALNINEFHLKLRWWRQADANNKYCHFLCVLAVEETTINTKFKSTALYKSKKKVQLSDGRKSKIKQGSPTLSKSIVRDKCFCAFLFGSSNT